MSRALDRLHRERAVLRARSGMERRRIAADLSRLGPTLAAADRIAALAWGTARSPAGWIGAAGLLTLLRPRRLLKKVGPLLAAWRLWRTLRPLLRPLLRSLARRPSPQR